MNEYQKNKIRMLDPQGLSGTIQHVLLASDTDNSRYEDILYYLLTKTLQEKSYYERLNKKFFTVLQDNGLITNELLGLEEKLS